MPMITQQRECSWVLSRASACECSAEGVPMSAQCWHHFLLILSVGKGLRVLSFLKCIDSPTAPKSYGSIFRMLDSPTLLHNIEKNIILNRFMCIESFCTVCNYFNVSWSVNLKENERNLEIPHTTFMLFYKTFRL